MRCSAVLDPRAFFTVSDRANIGVYPDRESANMARTDGHITIQESAFIVTQHDTMAEALRAIGHDDTNAEGNMPQ